MCICVQVKISVLTALLMMTAIAVLGVIFSSNYTANSVASTNISIPVVAVVMIEAVKLIANSGNAISSKSDRIFTSYT